MDSPTLTVLIAVAGLAAGFLVCWLLMRGRSAAPAPQAKPEAQGELAQAKDRIRQLEGERQLAVKNYEDLKHETARTRGVANVVKKDSAPPAEHIAQVNALQAQLAALQAQEQATRADAAKARSEALAEQAQAKDYFRSLEKNQQVAAASAQALQLEADRLRQALDKAHAEQGRVLALEQENAALKRGAAAVPASAQAARPATAPVQATQLPALEEQVLALQNLEKAIKKEFQLLSELQRNVTLTSATRHEFNESPESRTGSATAA